jgi:hypothetical protein
MDTGLLVALGAAAAVLLALLGVLCAVLVSSRRRTERALAVARVELDALRSRLEDIEASHRAAVAPPVVPEAEYLITTVGEPAGVPESAHVPDRLVLSATLGEPLVRIAAFGYGLRRALAPESRNRIVFEMRREVKRARKQRRRRTRRAARQAATRDVGREAA